MQIFLCIVASVLTSILVMKIQAMKYFDIVDDHIKKMMQDILDIMSDKRF